MKIAAVVPAAGASRRMGRAKLLLPWPGDAAESAPEFPGPDAGVEPETVLGAVVAALRDGGVEQIALVLAPPDDSPRGRAASDLHRWAKDRFPAEGWVLVENPDPDRGMLSSIHVGIDALGGAEALARNGVALMVTPGDLPALAATTVEAVRTRLQAGHAALVVPRVGGRRGHPLGIAPRLLSQIPELDLERGLRALMERHRDAVVEVAVNDPGAVRDVDTPADYRALAASRRLGPG